MLIATRLGGQWNSCNAQKLSLKVALAHVHVLMYLCVIIEGYTNMYGVCHQCRKLTVGSFDDLSLKGGHLCVANLL